MQHYIDLPHQIYQQIEIHPDRWRKKPQEKENSFCVHVLIKGSKYFHFYFALSSKKYVANPMKRKDYVF